MVLPRSFYTETNFYKKLAKKRLVFPWLAISNTLSLFFGYSRRQKFQKDLDIADHETRIFTHVHWASHFTRSLFIHESLYMTRVETLSAGGLDNIPEMDYFSP